MLRTVDNALIILDQFNNKTSWGVRELARELDINYTTVYKTLSTLKKHGLVIQNTDKDKYELGYKILEYYSTLKERIQFLDELSVIMNQITEKTKETVFLSIMEENYTVCVKISESSHSYLRLVIKEGNRMPLHEGSRGKVMLAFLPNQKQKDILDLNIEKDEENSKVKLYEELKEIRNQGWCLTIGERFESVTGISIPLFNNNNDVIASLTIGIPHSNIPIEKIKNYVSVLKDKQYTIESLLKLEN